MTWRVYVVIGIIVAILGAVAYLQRVVTNDALQGVERESNERAGDARDARDRYDVCPDGMWDFGAGKCKVTP